MKKGLLSLLMLISLGAFAQKNARQLTQKSAALSDTTFVQNGTTQTATLQSIYNLFGVAGKLSITDTAALHNQIAQNGAATGANTTAIAGKQPLENQRLSTTNLPQFTGINILPQTNLSTPAAGFNITDSTGAGATFIFPSGIRKILNWQNVTSNSIWKFQNKSGTVADSADVATNATSINSRLQTETQDYVTRVLVAGGRLDAATIGAIDKFVTAGKKDGWFALLNYIAPFCGNNLASSLVLLKAPAGVAFTPTSFTDADFDNTKGLTATIGKYLQTGYVPVNQGLTATNFTMAAARIAFTKSNTALFVSSIPASGEGSPIIDYNTAAIKRSVSTSPASEGPRAVVYVSRAGSWSGFSDGVQQQLGTASASTNANTCQYEITVFRGNTPDGATNGSAGTIGLLAFGTALTDAQALSLNRAILQFTQDVRTGYVKRGVTFSVLGDSNGQAWQSAPTWCNLLSREYGWRELNHAQQGSRLNADVNGGILSGLNRYLQVVDMNPEYGFIALGTNDALNDGQANGLSTTTTSLTTNLNTICSAYKSKYIKPFILGIPWNSTINTTKGALYTAAAASAAKTSGVPFVDLYNLFNDQTTPGSFFTDGTHFSIGGYVLVANAIVERLQGKMFRMPTLDFSSIAANSQADLTVTVYNAVAGMSVNVTPLGTLEAGLVPFAFVSANDTVTIRLTNTTGAAIDPASMQWKVTVFTNY